MTIGIGVELGQEAVRGAVLERSRQRLTLLRAHEVPCETSNADAVHRALTEVRERLRIRSAVILGVPGTSAILTTLHPLVVRPERAFLAVQFELQQQLPFQLADAVWHYQWLSANGHSAQERSRLKALGSARGSRLEALGNSTGLQPRASSLEQRAGAVVAAMRRSVLEERLAWCRRAGLSVQAVALTPIAVLNAWDFQPASASAAPLNPGGLTLLVRVSERAAEWVVRTADSVQAVPVASESSESLWRDLASSWDALSAQDAAPPTPVWVVGSSEAFRQAQEALGGQRRVPVERFDGTRLVGRGASLGPSARKPLPECDVAPLGLALQGLSLARTPVNLLSTAQRHERFRWIHRGAVIVSGLCAAAAMALGVSGMLEERRRTASLLQQLVSRERVYQTLRPDIRLAIQRQQRLERRSRLLERIATESPLVSQLFTQVADALPDTVWLTTFECSKSGGLNGLLEGRATSFQDVTRFLDRLKSVAGMTTVKPLSTEVKTDAASGKELVVFSVQFQRPLAPD